MLLLIFYTSHAFCSRVAAEPCTSLRVLQSACLTQAHQSEAELRPCQKTAGILYALYYTSSIFTTAIFIVHCFSAIKSLGPVCIYSTQKKTCILYIINPDGLCDHSLYIFLQIFSVKNEQVEF